MAFALFLLGCLMMCAVMFEWVDFMHPVRVWVLLTGSRLRSRIRRIVRFRTLPAMPAAYHLARREQDLRVPKILIASFPEILITCR